MANYSNGKVYKIECINDNQDEGCIYIGSTTKFYLSQRMDAHRSDYKKFKRGVKLYISSFDVFEKYGIENCRITLLETCSCNTKDELLAREAHFIRTLKCVNKNIPLRKNKEWRKDNIEDVKKYFLMRNDIKITCDCGSVHAVTKTFRHLRTKKHLKFIADQLNPIIVAEEENVLVVIL